ncbi:ThiF family adenylyltransferase [Kitasatospora sp. NPDC097605]|uniref:ThiF family adenylyltransferase n=1 Tax=Kitasatospora sp. NPDC097605 TaxID=3157226 RepID=UPI003331D242
MPPYQQPRVRTEHAPYRHRGEIRLASIPPLADAYPDDPWLWTLLEALDGTRTPDQAIDRVRNHHPEVPADLIAKAIEELTWAGHLEDAADDPGPAVPGTDSERYDRQIQYWRMVKPHDDRSAWQVQQSLSKRVVTIIGVGGAGVAAAYALAASGVGLHLIDPDLVELSNLSRQLLFTRRDIGQFKTRAAVDHLRRLNPGVTITCADGSVTHGDGFKNNMITSDLTILAGVEPHTLLPAANRAAVESRSVWIDTGYHGPVVSTTLYAPDTATACWECLRRADATQSGLGDLTGEDLVRALPRPLGQNAPATAITAMLAGTYAAHAALAHLTGTSPWPAGAVLQHNLITNTQRTITHPRDTACPACAR